jgi:hypothetical protein
VQISPASHHFILVRSKYSPQQPILRYLQFMFVYNYCFGGAKSFLEILKGCSSIYGTNFNTRFEVLTGMNIKTAIFWKVKSCSLVKVYHLSDHTASHT